MTQTTTTTFKDLNLSQNILEALDNIGFVTPSPIQEQCIPILTEGRDILAVAQTGSGKTAGFLLPAIQNIDVTLRMPQVLIIAPTH
ncbi:MAG: DEAD/DEAH box helicase, partial [Psittacicella sp.]